MYEHIGPPGFAIESLGLKGFSIGGALVSPDHANFFVNKGCAKSGDMLELINLVRSQVKDSTGYDMRVEVRRVGLDGRILPI